MQVVHLLALKQVSVLEVLLLAASLWCMHGRGRTHLCGTQRPTVCLRCMNVLRG